MEPEIRRHTNVAQGLADNFKVEQERFLIAQLQFKNGYIYSGMLATSLLTSMFYILPAGRLIAKDEKKAEDFVNRMDAFRFKCATYARTKIPDGELTPNMVFPVNQSYMELDDEFDALVREFYKIMYETGFSP